MSSLLGNFHCTQTCTYTQTRTDSKPFSISACLYAALVSKCRSYTDPKDLQRSGAAQDHARFLYACVCVCVCVYGVAESLWFKYVSCCIPYGQNYLSQGTSLQAGNRAFVVACQQQTRIPFFTHT